MSDRDDSRNITFCGSTDHAADAALVDMMKSRHVRSVNCIDATSQQDTELVGNRQRAGGASPDGRLYGQPRHYSRARWGAGAHCSRRKAWLGGLRTKLQSSLVARAASAQRQAFYSARKGAVWYWSTMIPVPCAWRYHIFKTWFRVPV